MPDETITLTVQDAHAPPPTEVSSTMKRLATLLAVLAVFAAGAVAGAVGWAWGATTSVRAYTVTVVPNQRSPATGGVMYITSPEGVSLGYVQYSDKANSAWPLGEPIRLDTFGSQ